MDMILQRVLQRVFWIFGRREARWFNRVIGKGKNIRKSRRHPCDWTSGCVHPLLGGALIMCSLLVIAFQRGVIP